MANRNMPRGFECKGVPLRANAYLSGAACYPGDLVNMGSAGTVAPASAGALILGVCLSYCSAASQIVLVADHPDQLIVGQATSTEVAAQTDLNGCCDHVASSPDTTYKTSRHIIDSTGISHSATAGLRLLALEAPVGETGFGAYAKVVCAINEHQFGPAQANAGVGV